MTHRQLRQCEELNIKYDLSWTIHECNKVVCKELVKREKEKDHEFHSTT